MQTLNGFYLNNPINKKTVNKIQDESVEKKRLVWNLLFTLHV